MLLIEVARRAQHQDSLQIDAIRLSQERESLQGSGVLHRPGHVIALPLRVVLTQSMAHWLSRLPRQKVMAALVHRIGIDQLQVFRKPIRLVDQRGV
jgi:hypothetical protein